MLSMPEARCAVPEPHTLNVAHGFLIMIWEMEAERSDIQDHLWLHSKHKANLGYIKTVFKINVLKTGHVCRHVPLSSALGRLGQKTTSSKLRRESGRVVGLVYK